MNDHHGRVGIYNHKNAGVYPMLVFHRLVSLDPEGLQSGHCGNFLPTRSEVTHTRAKIKHKMDAVIPYNRGGACCRGCTNVTESLCGSGRLEIRTKFIV